ncbi:PcfK-like family protein [Faecalibacillus intestinalis]|jgi:hypothetical protein|uniref:PcfK-like family protein n=1 Tax=Faecalibacillus intestinalis TaxID=1982626 RepID=A0AAP2UFL3_9FIRM|nr:Cas9 inhibitor AcrIIA9 family protein [Faecalibacillus intestinalis]RGE92844.1 hypothetical protein DW660_11975 [Coprobacillus sp. AM23-9LB]RGG77669.1 hypothetical protein DWW80_13990 [Coprobacillus sp. AF17-17AC]RGG83195.1 hypothetical protein DWW76_12945 [Coprobacillus sp. AF17-11AC]MCB8591050.1 PcfK-like family protein [Faecalibacillus intestinalis]MCB8612105.1 PcfK-like family protein [Faecalibacillus intestinalis]
MNFLEQMQDSNDPMIVMIKNHLLSRNDTSELLKKENKNIEDMMLFIGHELYVKYLKGKNNHRMACVAGPDEELYGIVMHYLDEDDIDMKKIENEMSRISFVNQEQKNPNQEEKIPKNEEKMQKILKNTHKESKTIKKAKKKAKKSTIAEGQMSIFDL